MDTTINQSMIKETNEVNISYDEENRKIVNDFLFVKTLGKGSYSKVKLSVNVNDNKKYAVKIIDKRLLKKKKKGYGRDSQGNMKIFYMIDDALNEIQIYKSFPHMSDYVIKLYEIINDNEREKTYLIVELAEHGSIMQFNDRTGVFSINSFYGKTSIDYEEERLRQFILDMAEGLEFRKDDILTEIVHSNNIVHRDIKTDNILLDESGRCKIVDFGTAAKIEKEDKFTKTEGNLYFFPPEFCDGSEHKVFAGKPVDIWAMGVTIYVVAFKKLPFMPSNPSNLMELFQLINKAEITFPDNAAVSEEFKTLLLKILEKDPTKRLTASEIKNYQW